MSPSHRARPFLALLAASVFSLAACSGSADPTEETNAGYAALGEGNAAAALDHFAAALEVLKPTDSLYKRARMGEIQSKVSLKPDAAAQSFIEYAGQQPEQVDAGDYHKVGMQLTDRKALGDAVTVLEAGRKRYPDDAKIDEALKMTTEAAQASGDASVLERLKSLGYVGG